MLIRQAAFVVVGMLAVGLATAAPAFATAPAISSFTPTSGPAGTVVTVNGTAFAAPVTVRFGGVAATAASVVSATKVTATVPPTATTGTISVTTTGGTATSAATFTVTPSATVIPAVGPPASVTALTASGLGNSEAVDVYVDTANVALSVSSPTGTLSTNLTIPASTTPGAHWITVIGRRSGNAAQTSFTVRSSWLQEGDGAAHTGLSTTENVLSPSSVGRLGELYRVGPLDGFSPIGLAVSGGVVYAAFQVAGVTAYTEATGARRWNTPVVGDQYVDTAPALAGPLLYVGTGTSLTAIRTANGTVAWTADGGAELDGSPAVAGGIVYFGTTNGILHAVNATTGAQIWTYDSGTTATSFGPAVANGRVFFGAGPSVAALDAATGNLLWAVTTNSTVCGDLTAMGGLVYVPTNAGLQTFHVQNSTVGFTYTPATGTVSGVAAAQGVAYVAVGAGPMAALNGASGDVLWTRTLPGGDSLNARPSVANGVVYVSGTLGTYALASASGSLLWSTADTIYFTGPTIVDGTLFTAPRGELVAYSVGAGAGAVAARPNPAVLRASR